MRTLLPTYPESVAIRGIKAFRFDTRASNTTYRTAPAPRVAFVLLHGRAYAVSTNVNFAYPRSVLVDSTALTINEDIVAPSIRLQRSPVEKESGGGGARVRVNERAPNIRTFADLLVALNDPHTYGGAIAWLADEQKALVALLFGKRAPRALIPRRPHGREGGWRMYVFEMIDGRVHCNKGPIAIGALDNARLELTANFTVTGGSGETRGPLFVYNKGWCPAVAVTIVSVHTILAKELWDNTGGAVDALVAGAGKRSPTVSEIQSSWELNVDVHSLAGLAGHTVEKGTSAPPSRVPVLLYRAMVKDNRLFPKNVGYTKATAALLEHLVAKFNLTEKEAKARVAVAMHNIQLGHTIEDAVRAERRLPITPGVPFVAPVVNKDPSKSGGLPQLRTLFDEGGFVFVQNKEDGWRATVHVHGGAPAVSEMTLAKFSAFHAAQKGGNRGGSIVVLIGKVKLGEYSFYPIDDHWRAGWEDSVGSAVTVRFSLPPANTAAHIDLFTKPDKFDGNNIKKLDSPGWQEFLTRAKGAFAAAAPCVVDCELVAYDNGRTRADAVAPGNAQLRVFDCYVFRGDDISDRPHWARRNALMAIEETANVHVPPPRITRVRTGKEAKAVVDAALGRCRANKIEGIIVRTGGSAVSLIGATRILCFKPAWDDVRWPLRATMRFMGWSVRGRVALFGVLGNRYEEGHPWHNFVPVAATTFFNIDLTARQLMIDTAEAPGRTDPVHNCYMAMKAPSFFKVTCERILPYRSPEAIKKWAPAAVYMQRIRVRSTSSRRPATLAEFDRLEAMACNP